MSNVMAEFGQGYVQAQSLNENNSVKYKFSIAGSCAKSTVKPYIRLQDKDVITPGEFSPGVNVFEFNADTRELITRKSYVFTSDNSATNQAFITYMDSLPAKRIIFIVSNTSFQTESWLNDWFTKHSSSAWPTPWQTSKFDVSYSAMYLSDKKTIVKEHVLYNDRVQVENLSTPLDVVFDSAEDIGATGTPGRVIEYLSEVSNTNNTTGIIRLPTSAGTSVPTADYNIIPGDVLYLKADLFADQALCDVGTVRISVRWLKGLSMISFQNIEYNVLYPGTWQTFEREVECPPEATMFTVYIEKTVGVGVGSARNIIMAEMTRAETPMMRPAEFGVNGIRMNVMVDNDVTTDLLQLVNSDWDERGIVKSTEFREKSM